MTTTPVQESRTETAEEWPHGRCSICGGFEPSGYHVFEGHLSDCAYFAPVVNALRERMKAGHGLEQLSPEELEQKLASEGREGPLPAAADTET